MRDRPGLDGAALIEIALGATQPTVAALTRRELGRQLIAALVAVTRVLFAVDLIGLAEDLPSDAVVVTRRVLGGVGVHLRAVDRDHADLDHPGPRAQPENTAEEVRDRVLVTLAKPRDRRVIGHLVRRDHPKRDVLHTRPLDPPRRALPTRIRVHQQRDHHRRIMRRATVTIRAI